MQNLNLQTPPKGWNSFDCYGIFINEQQALSNLNAFVEKLKPHGYEYFCIDAGWYSEYPFQFDATAPINKHEAFHNIDEYGRLIASPKLFPRGLKYIADQVHAHGLKFGIHIMRGIPRKAVEQNTPIAHTNHHAKDIADIEDTCTWCPLMYGVNMKHPAAQAYYDSVIADLADNGVDLIKADDITPYPDEIQAVHTAIQNSGRPIALSLSPGGQTAQINLNTYQYADMLRLSGDVWDSRDDLNKCFDRWELWQNVQEPGLWLDLDMIPFGALQVYAKQSEADDSMQLLTGRGSSRMCQLTEAQKRTFITMRALAASPLIMGGELTQTPQSDFDLITHPQILACCNNGVIGKRIYAQSHIDIRKTPDIHNPDTGWIGIFNRDVISQTVCLAKQNFQFDAQKIVKIDNIWKNAIIQHKNNQWVFKLEPDDVCFIRYE